jgi:phage terminase large subunit GpA-like protein
VTLLLSPMELRALRPPARHPLSEWCEQHRQVVRSAIPGPWRNANAPHLEEVLDSLNDPEVEQVSLMCATQVGKTELLLNWVLYLMSEDPGDALFVMGSEDAAREFSQERLLPAMMACDATRHLIGPRPKSDRKILSFSIGDMELNLAWAGSPTQLASRPIKNLLCDEVDKYPLLLGREGDPVSLAIERTKTYDDAKKVLCSSPTTREGLIYRAWETSDQREYLVPCQSCGHFQRITFERLTWPERPEGRSHREHADWISTRDVVRLPCESCGYEHADRHRISMLRAGRWVPAGCTIDRDGNLHGLPETPARHRGYRITTISALTMRRAWSKAVAKFLESQGNPGALRNFRNGWLAEIWEDRAAAISENHITAAAGSHERRQVPDAGVVLTLGADVQDSCIYYVVRAWGPHEESWLVDCGVVDGFEQLAQIERAHWIVAGKAETRRIAMSCIDSGHRTMEVYEFCRADPAIRRPVKGKDHLGGQTWRGTAAQSTRRGRALPGGLRLILLDTSALKDKLTRLQTLPEDVPGGWWTFRAVPEDYVKHMTAEHKVRKVDKRGRVTEMWVPRYVGAPNHWFDGEVYALACAEMLQVWALSPADPDSVPQSAPRGRRGTGATSRRRRW